MGALSVPVSPGSAAAAAAEDEASPATGATVFAREDVGSGGRSTGSSVGTGAINGVEDARAAAGRGVSCPAAPSAR